MKEELDSLNILRKDEISNLTYYKGTPEDIQVNARIPSCLESNFCKCDFVPSDIQLDKNYNFQLLKNGLIDTYD